MRQAVAHPAVRLASASRAQTPLVADAVVVGEGAPQVGVALGPEDEDDGPGGEHGDGEDEGVEHGDGDAVVEDGVGDGEGEG